MKARAPITSIIATVASATSAFAANGAQADEPGILVWAFMGFAAVIVAGQMVPAAMLVIGAVKALFGKPEAAKLKA
ncbi:hypothetical protein [Geomonas azotofigens]|uniref:hypothetical protein n=1 Tax=Geomonas azotofigens TaxID=2843196 RepID=UPI001C116A92|nr:hypothetical protein [Geomonas azotofigens]MBU5612923.1 hypothetical protein [Geomonas azotofigens]